MPKNIEYDMHEVTTKIAVDYFPRLSEMSTDGITDDNAKKMLDALASFACDIIPFIADTLGREANEVKRTFIGLVKLDIALE
jgi:hypothetical protein